MSTETAIQVQNQDQSVLSLSDTSRFEHIQRVASMLSKSQLIPVTFQNNVPNCVIALEMSQRLGASALMVMQNLNIIHGKPSWGAQFMIASVNACRRFSPLRFAYIGEPNTDEWGCYAHAKAREDGAECRGVTVTIGIAKKEGWFSKNGSKWLSMPELMLSYRAATWWTRMWAPEILMGFPTEDEVVDVEMAATAAGTIEPAAATPAAEQQVTSRRRKGVSAMKQAEPVAPPQTTPTPSPTSVPTDPAPAAAPASFTMDEVKNPASEAETKPASTPEPEQKDAPAAPPAATTTPAPTANPAPAAAAATPPPAAVQSQPTQTGSVTPVRCEVTEVTETDARKSGGVIGKVCKVELLGDVNCVAYYDGPRSSLPSIGAIIDAVLSDKTLRGAPVKILDSFTVVG